MILMVVIYYKIFCEIKRRGKIDIGRNMSVSCADHRSSLSKSSLKKQQKLLQRSNYLRSGRCASCSSLNAKQITRISFNTNEPPIDRERSSQTDKQTDNNSNKDKSSSEDLSLSAQSKLHISSASVVSGDQVLGGVGGVEGVTPNASVKHYQQLTLMSVKPEKPAVTALEDYRGVKVEVEYINGGSTVSVVNRDYNCELNKKREVPEVEAAVIGGQLDTARAKQKSAKSGRKANKKAKSGPMALDVNCETSEQSNDSLRMKIKRRISKKRFNETLVLEVNENRNSRPSIALPANEFCSECQCTAAAAVAATHHMNALRREESSRLRQEKKAARQLGVILGAFILCWMPYIITFIVTAYCTDCVSSTVHQVAIWLGRSPFSTWAIYQSINLMTNHVVSSEASLRCENSAIVCNIFNASVIERQLLNAITVEVLSHEVSN